MDTNQRIRQLMKERGLTEYRLALDSGLSKSTVSALLHRNFIVDFAHGIPFLLLGNFMSHVLLSMLSD